MSDQNTSWVTKSPRELLAYSVFVLFKRRWSIAIIFVLTVIAVLFGTYLLTPTWEATNTLIVQTNPAQHLIVFDDLETPVRTEEASPADVVEILTGEKLAAEIVEEFGLDDKVRERKTNPKNLRETVKQQVGLAITWPLRFASDQGWLPPLEPNYKVDAIEELIEEMQAIEPVEGAKMVEVTISADSPALAVAISNRMTEKLQERVQRFNHNEAEQTYNFLDSQLADVRDALEREEDALADFRRDEKLADPDQQRTILVARQASLIDSLAQNENEIAAALTRMSDLQAQLEYPTSTDAAVDDEFAPFRNSLDEREVEQQIVAAKTNLKALRELNSRLQDSLEEIEAELGTVSPRELEYERRTRAVDGLKERYMKMQTALLELEVQKSAERPEYDIKVASAAFVPEGSKPDSPVWLLAVAGALLGGVGLALGQAFFREYLVDPLEQTGVVSEITGMDVLATVPPLRWAGWQRRLAGVTGSSRDAAVKSAAAPQRTSPAEPRTAEPAAT